MTIRSWREVIAPHDDVLEGTFQEAEFAADLTQVVRGTASPDYQDPVRFFERTVITEGMSLLLQSVVKRLSGKGGDPVVQLQTAFGGGKTHTMMAVLHVASGKAPAEKLQGVPALLDKAKVKRLVRANVAVLDGNALAPSQPRQHAKISANTLWGELAFQLGGAEGYAMVADADRDGTSPGKDVLAAVLEKFGPAIVLMDETVAYLRQLQPGKSYTGGTFNSNLSFVQALTEAAARVPNAMVLASLPESAMEVGDGHGKDALDSLQKYFGRIEAVWKPVDSDEAFEIVRRRLFGKVLDEAARDEVCHAFADLYRTEGDKFPSDTRDGEYLRRLQRSYPIHPELFDRLYGDWSHLPKFQRTRGVLRLMARLVHSLWSSGNTDFLILPGSTPLDDINVRNELVKYLPAGWDPIVDKEIDGKAAEPMKLDNATPALGALQACRRAARTIFMGSAPSVGNQNVRGIGVEQVRLGCAQPGQPLGKYDDALKRLAERLHNLYTGSDHYWFDLRANLRREMETRMARFNDREQLYPELEKRLQKVVRPGLCRAVHVFVPSKDLPDLPDLRLVVLAPDQVHKRKDWESPAIAAARDRLGKHGEKQRTYQNRLLFLAPDGIAVSALFDHLKRFLAWSSIVDDADELNLDKHNETEAKKGLDEAGRRVEGSIRETYRYLLAPMQDPDEKGGPATTAWEETELNLGGSTPFDKAIEVATREKEWVIQGWAPIHLSKLLNRWFFKDGAQTAGAKRVWLDTCRYLYLPRLVSEDVFVRAISDGVAQSDFFGYAAGEVDGEGLEGFRFEKSGSVYLDDASVLIALDLARKTAAKKQLEAGQAVGPHGPRPSTSGTARPTSGGRPARPTTSSGSAPKRFHGSVEIDPRDPNGSFATLVAEVIEHFTAKLGVEVKITVDLEARGPSGFDSKLVRVVRENSGQLKFKSAEFEEE